MSLYCTVETQMKNPEALILALMEIGNWSQGQIEVYTVPQTLYGYQNDARQERANIIIRRKHVGPSSNDIGFIKNEDNTYTAIISKFDKSRYSQSWIDKLKQNYSYYAIKLQQEKRGRSVTRIKLPNNKVRVEVRGYR